MSVKDILTRRALSAEEAAKVWAVSNWVAIVTHAAAWALGLTLGYKIWH